MTDCHVHLAFDSGPDPIGTTAQATPAEHSAGMAERARQLLTAGVTTLRDLGDRDALAASLRSAITSGALPGPRILTATAPPDLARRPLRLPGRRGHHRRRHSRPHRAQRFARRRRHHDDGQELQPLRRNARALHPDRALGVAAVAAQQSRKGSGAHRWTPCSPRRCATLFAR
ncbi:amidohydrolase family protein [Micromonospora sp. NPDC047548]|uniref:amidohydrolase family protein n=1 Tax=Micromonospora sp. NPDC047548 TaxID=3155624 RepID=UPI003406F82A